MATQAEIDEVVAKLAITDVLHRYARGLDRMDIPMTLSCWHPGGTDDHAPLFSGTAAGFVEWLWPVHAAMTMTRHVVTNVMIEVNGDKAASECYWTVTLRPRDEEGQLYNQIGQGRYIDQFEKIDGVWAIRHRQSIGDRWHYRGPVDENAPVKQLIKPNNPEAPLPNWARDPSDHSYKVMTRKFA